MADSRHSAEIVWAQEGPQQSVRVFEDDSMQNGRLMARAFLLSTNLAAISGVSPDAIFLENPVTKEVFFPDSNGAFTTIPMAVDRLVIRSSMLVRGLALSNGTMGSLHGAGNAELRVSGPPMPPPPLSLHIPGISRAPPVVRPVPIGVASDGSGRRGKNAGKEVLLKFIPLKVNFKACTVSPSVLEVEQWNVDIDDLNSEGLKALVSKKVGSPQVLCTRDGRKIPENDVSSRPEFWKKPRGYHSSPVYFLPKEEAEYLEEFDKRQMDSRMSYGEGSVTGQKDMTALEWMKMKQQQEREDAALAELAKDMACKFCMEMVKSVPVFCGDCKRLAGCEGCVNKWIMEGGSCPICQDALLVPRNTVRIQGWQEGLMAIGKIADLDG